MNTFYPLNPTGFTYQPDMTKQGVSDQIGPGSVVGRLTYQLNPKNKVSGSYMWNNWCECHFGISATNTPQSDIRSEQPGKLTQLAWTSPITNRLLFESGFSAYRMLLSRALQTDPLAIAPTVVDENGFRMRESAASGSTAGPHSDVQMHNTSFRGAMSYVTGAHAFRLGGIVQPISNGLYAYSYDPVKNPNGVNYEITTLRGLPSRVTYIPMPINLTVWGDKVGLFAQDQWTHKRLTANYGVRYDWMKTGYLDGVAAPNLQGFKALKYPAGTVINWKDLSPRLGMAYDVFGTGKTALKMSINRYLNDLSLFNNVGGTPIQGYQTTAARTWTDSNKNFYPDCDFLNPAAQNLSASGGDICGAFTGVSANFGQSVPTSVDDHDVDFGWHHRPKNWEFSADVQQELIAEHMSVDVDVFRRSYGNFTTSDNPLTTAANYDKFTVTVPTDPGLPQSGQTLTFLDPNPSVSSLVTTNQVFLSSHFGEQTEIWKGYDVSLNYRKGSSLRVQGGMGAIKETSDNCAVVATVPEAAVPTVTPTGLPPTIAGPLGVPFCHQETPMLLQWKGYATYTLPKIDLLVSGTFQNSPGPQLSATLVVQGAAGTPVAAQLGHALSTGTATVNILAPGTAYGERLNQVDLRVGKVMRFARNRRIIASVDMYNALNGNAVLRQSAPYPTASTQSQWGVPQLVQQGRLFKFTLSTDF